MAIILYSDISYKTLSPHKCPPATHCAFRLCEQSGFAQALGLLRPCRFLQCFCESAVPYPVTFLARWTAHRAWARLFLGLALPWVHLYSDLTVPSAVVYIYLHLGLTLFKVFWKQRRLSLFVVALRWSTRHDYGFVIVLLRQRPSRHPRPTRPCAGLAATPCSSLPREVCWQLPT